MDKAGCPFSAGASSSIAATSRGWRVFAVIHEHLLAIHEQTSVNGANRRLHARCIRTRIRLGNCKSECKASRILIFKANGVGLRRTRESLEDLELKEIVLERQGRARNARQFLEYKNLREHVVMNMIATMDDAKPIEIEVDERLHDLIGQAHIAAPLRNRLIIKVILPNSRTCEISTRSASLNMKSIAAPSYSRNHDGFSSRHPLYICFEYAPQQAPLAFRFAKRGAFHNTMARL